MFGLQILSEGEEEESFNHKIREIMVVGVVMVFFFKEEDKKEMHTVRGKY